MLCHIAFCPQYQVILSGITLTGAAWSAIVAKAGNERDAMRAFRTVAGRPDVPVNVFSPRVVLAHRGREISCRSVRA